MRHLALVTLPLVAVTAGWGPAESGFVIGLFLFIGMPIICLYLLVRFIKWAWNR